MAAMLASVHILHTRNSEIKKIKLTRTLILDLPVRVPVGLWEGPKLQYGFLYSRHFLYKIPKRSGFPFGIWLSEFPMPAANVG